jgi:hypothetical protein
MTDVTLADEKGQAVRRYLYQIQKKIVMASNTGDDARKIVVTK